MKQKIVIRINLRCEKCRSKAMTIAATAPGFLSVNLEGEERDQLVVIGDGVDAARITRLLRDKVANASLELVHALED